MSLDVYLLGKEKETMCTCSCGNEHTSKERRRLYESNITHNLGKMAGEAGIYKHLWRPEELGITVAKDLIEPLKKGLQNLKDRPEYFEQFNASNGWGMYKHFVPFVEDYLNACIENPEATVVAST